MSSPQDWVEAVERRIGRSLSRSESSSVEIYATEEAIRDVNDEDVDNIVWAISEEESI